MVKKKINKVSAAAAKKVSAIVLVGGKYQDDKLLGQCLDSLSWCGEIVKVETDKIKGGFAEWRNYGAKVAKGEWLLYVDSDEVVGPKLADTILLVTGSNEFSAYAIPRKNIFLGRGMRWGGWSPDFVLRLIRKENLKEWVGDLHEQPKINGPIMHLKEPLVHRSHRSLWEMVEKTNEWSEIEAKLLYNAGHPKMNVLRFFSAGLREFWYRAVIKIGFLDGMVGIIEIFYQTFSKLVTYSKLWELQIKHESSDL